MLKFTFRIVAGTLIAAWTVFATIIVSISAEAQQASSVGFLFLWAFTILVPLLACVAVFAGLRRLLFHQPVDVHHRRRRPVLRG